jgi:hypothetical protein
LCINLVFINESYTAMNKRDLRMGEWNNQRQWNMKVGRRRQTFKTTQYIYVYKRILVISQIKN